MKKVLKILGITAAVAALTPYRIHKDKETGEKKVEALLWRATAAPKDGEEKMTLDVSVGFQSPFASKSEEPLFEEEPVAEFEVTEETGGEAEAGAEDAAEDAAEAEVEAVKAAAEEAAPEEAQQETPAE